MTGDRPAVPVRDPRVLQQMCVYLADLLSMDGASIYIPASADGAELAVSSDHVGEDLVELQLTLDQGPLIDTRLSGRPSHEPDLAAGAAASRWPDFVSIATLTIGAVFTFPIHPGAAMPLGAFLLYRRTPGNLHGDGLEAVQVFTDALSGRVAPDSDDDELMFARQDVSSAAGIVAAHLDIEVTQALGVIRAAATGDRLVDDVVQDVLHDRVRFDTDGPGPSD